MTLVPDQDEPRIGPEVFTGWESMAEDEVPNADSNGHRSGAADGTPLFRLWTPGELIDAPRSFQWLLRGQWVTGSHGMIGGDSKTLKTYVSMCTWLAVASGTAAFGQFGADQAGPVVVYVGEGGRAPYTRRLERIADAMGVSLRELPFSVSFDVAPIGSDTFRRSLERDLADLAPALVVIDPYYAFHGGTTDARNLFEEGSHLTSLSAPCGDAGAALHVINHFNQTGAGRNLKRFTQAGGAEWSDSWMLLSHREDPDVDAGSFRLLLEIGSRQWGGTTWELDFQLGEFNIETGEHVGDLKWTLRRSSSKKKAKSEPVEKIMQLLADEPWMHTFTQVVGAVGGNADQARSALKNLIATGEVVVESLERDEGKRTSVRRDLLATGDEPVPSDRRGWSRTLQ